MKALTINQNFLKNTLDKNKIRYSELNSFSFYDCWSEVFFFNFDFFTFDNVLLTNQDMKIFFDQISNNQIELKSIYQLGEDVIKTSTYYNFSRIGDDEKTFLIDNIGLVDIYNLINSTPILSYCNYIDGVPFNLNAIRCLLRNKGQRLNQYIKLCGEK